MLRGKLDNDGNFILFLPAGVSLMVIHNRKKRDPVKITSWKQLRSVVSAIEQAPKTEIQMSINEAWEAAHPEEPESDRDE